MAAGQNTINELEQRLQGQAQALALLKTRLADTEARLADTEDRCRQLSNSHAAARQLEKKLTRQLAHVVKEKEEESARLQTALRREMEFIKKLEVARTREEEARSREEEARTSEVVARSKEEEARSREEEARKREATTRKGLEEVNRREEEARRKLVEVMSSLEQLETEKLQLADQMAIFKGAGCDSCRQLGEQIKLLQATLAANAPAKKPELKNRSSQTVGETREGLVSRENSNKSMYKDAAETHLLRQVHSIKSTVGKENKEGSNLSRQELELATNKVEGLSDLLHLTTLK
jgi:hypothetical protein